MNDLHGKKEICSRALCLTLALAIPSAHGCRLAGERAANNWARVAVGMKQSEVLDQLGEPDAVVRESEHVIWIYRYRYGSGLVYWTGKVLYAVVIVPLAILGSRGGIHFGSSGRDTSNEEHLQFRIYFHPGPDSSAFWISPPEPITEMPGEEAS